MLLFFTIFYYFGRPKKYYRDTKTVIMLFLTAMPIVANFLEVSMVLFSVHIGFNKVFLPSIEYHRRDSTIPVTVLQMPLNDV
jgi:hypothetical protein